MDPSNWSRPPRMGFAYVSEILTDTQRFCCKSRYPSRQVCSGLSTWTDRFFSLSPLLLDHIIRMPEKFYLPWASNCSCHNLLVPPFLQYSFCYTKPCKCPLEVFPVKTRVEIIIWLTPFLFSPSITFIFYAGRFWCWFTIWSNSLSGKGPCLRRWSWTAKLTIPNSGFATCILFCSFRLFFLLFH